MGIEANGVCPQCGARGDGLVFGAPRAGMWPMEWRTYVCDPCDRLQSVRMVVPLQLLRAVVERGEAPPPYRATELPQTVQDLASLLLTAKQWPNCSRCRKQLRGRARREPCCPRCGSALEVEVTHEWG